MIQMIQSQLLLLPSREVPQPQSLLLLPQKISKRIIQIQLLLPLPNKEFVLLQPHPQELLLLLFLVQPHPQVKSLIGTSKIVAMI